MSRLRVLCLVFLLICGAFAFWIYLHRDKVGQSTFDKINLDMSVKEVYALLGRSPDRQGHLREIGEEDSQISFHEWNASELTIVVMFDANGQVVDRYRDEPESQPWYIRLLRTVKRSIGLR